VFGVGGGPGGICGLVSDRGIAGLESESGTIGSFLHSPGSSSEVGSYSKCACWLLNVMTLWVEMFRNPSWGDGMRRLFILNGVRLRQFEILG